MTREETKSCIGTIKMLQRLAYNIHGVMDVIDADNCKKIIKALEQEPCEELPPVTPQPKMGHWIGDGNYICSCCKRNPLDFLEPCGLDGGSYMDIPMKYCPNCGAKMVEPQESEDKE